MHVKSSIMVVSNSASKLSKFSTASNPVATFDLSFERLSILSPIKPKEEPGEREEDTESFNEEDFLFIEGEEGAQEVEKDAFQYNGKGGVAMCEHQGHEASCDLCDLVYAEGFSDMGHTGMDSGCSFFSSYDGVSSPVDIAAASRNMASKSRSSRKGRKSSLSVRESLLAEAWERKRELMLHEDLSNVKEHAKPELIGRIVSNCANLILDASSSSELKRSRTRSLTNEDFEELRGCIDLGFRFDQSSIPDLCDTLPALEIYYAVSQNLHETPNCMSPVSPAIQLPARCSSPSPTPSWKISSPGDDPKDVKERLRHWAQAVACNVRLCY